MAHRGRKERGELGVLGDACVRNPRLGADARCGRKAAAKITSMEAAMAGQQRDVIEVLEHDHRAVEQMFAELESLRGASTEEAKSARGVDR